MWSPPVPSPSRSRGPASGRYNPSQKSNGCCNGWRPCCGRRSQLLPRVGRRSGRTIRTTSPPRPPEPPSTPRRLARCQKLVLPAPPLPATAVTRSQSTNLSPLDRSRVAAAACGAAQNAAAGEAPPLPWERRSAVPSALRPAHCMPVANRALLITRY